MQAAPHAITAVSALSPFGVGAPALAHALRRGERPAVQPLEGAYGGPASAACVPPYDARELLGVRSVRQFDRLTLHIGVAVEELLERLGMKPPAARSGQIADERISLVLGSAGPLQSIMNFDLQAIDDPRYVQPGVYPNVVMNAPASYAAIRHAIRGSCITLTDGPSAMLKALDLAQAQLDAGRSDLVLCGGAEEATPAYALSVQAEAQRMGQPMPVLVEGAALLALEPAAQAQAQGRRALAGLHRCAQAFVPNRPAQALARVLDRLRSTVPAAMQELSAVYADGPVDPLAEGLAGVRCHRLGAQWFDTPASLGTLAAGFGVLSLLHDAQRVAGEQVLVVQCDDQGSAAAALLQKY